MLGRRQIREKVLQSLYAIERSENDKKVVATNMYKAIDEIYDLYISLINLLLMIQQLAEQKIELGKQKNFPTAEDLNPNLRFVRNPIFSILRTNIERKNYTENNKQLWWESLDSIPNNILKELLQSDLYQDYMNDENVSFRNHKDFIMALYEQFIAGNDDLLDSVEEVKLHWSSDLHIANTMVYNTIRSLTPKSDEFIKLFKTYKNEDDEDFAKSLFSQTIRYQDKTIEQVKELASNWEIDRIAKLDLLILQMALTEFEYFPSIPPKVTINEYIELAKQFSTEKSKVFVNGILDRYLKEKTQKDS